MCRKLSILYMSNNGIKNWSEIDKLRDLPKIQNVLFIGNPIYLKGGDMEPMMEVLRRVDTL